MKTVEASVVIPTYNKVHRLKLALQSLNIQTQNAESFEVIVIDDGSTDSTEKMIKDLQTNYSLKYIHEENLGRSSARNRGITESSGDIIIFSDDDMIVSNDFIRSHIENQKKKERVVVHGKIYNLSYLKFFANPSTGEFYQGLKEEVCNFEFIRNYLISADDIRNPSKLEQQKKVTFFEKIVHSTFLTNIYYLQWLGFTGGNVSCKKKYLVSAGMFDEEFGREWGCEDLELGYRLYLTGMEFLYSDEAYNYHIAHVRTGYREAVEKSCKMFYLKHPNPFIKHLGKLLLDEIKDVPHYVQYVRGLMEINQNSLIEKIVTENSFNTTIGGIIPAKRILVLAPHQDDEVLGCGGTLLKYLDKDAEVVILYMTDGRYGFVKGDEKDRNEEARAAWRGYKISQVFFDYRDSHIDTLSASSDIVKRIYTLNPDIIFVPWAVDMHIDHRITAYCLACALKIIKNSQTLVCSYEIMSPLYANKVVNISKQFKNKIRLIEAYKSQMAYLNLSEIIINMGKLRAKITQLKSFEAAEAFFVCSSDDYVNIINKIFY